MAKLAHAHDLARHLVALGDDSLVLGQNLASWCGHAPTLELDLALTNISLDCIGLAQVYLQAAAEHLGVGDADRLAFRRDVLDFRNLLLVEQPNGDFGRTIARQLLYSQWHVLALERLARSPCEVLADVAPKAAKEAAYHLRFAQEWAQRLAGGTAESRARLEDGLAWCGRFVDELFLLDDHGAALVVAGVIDDPASLRPRFDQGIVDCLGDLARALDRSGAQIGGGRMGRHTEHLGRLLSDLQFLQRAYPERVW